MLLWKSFLTACTRMFTPKDNFKALLMADLGIER